MLFLRVFSEIAANKITEVLGDREAPLILINAC